SGSWNGARGMRTATNCSGLGMSVLGPTTGQTEKLRIANVFRFAPESGLPILELLPLPALGERGHRGLARRLVVAVRRRAAFVVPEGPAGVPKDECRSVRRRCTR